MISSLYQIEFISASGTIRLVSAGDLISGELNPNVTQQTTQYSAIGALWAEIALEAAASVTLSFTVAGSFSSQEALRGWVLARAATFPARQIGILRISIQGGDTWDIHNAAITSSSPLADVEGFLGTLTSYAVTGGEMLPYGTITLYAGIPWQFINQHWEDLTSAWETL